MNFGDFQLQFYAAGALGKVSTLPFNFAELESRAEQTLGEGSSAMCAAVPATSTPRTRMSQRCVAMDWCPGCCGIAPFGTCRPHFWGARSRARPSSARWVCWVRFVTVAIC